MRSFVYGLCLFEGSPSCRFFKRYLARARPDFYPVRLGFQTVCFDRGAGGSERACILKRSYCFSSFRYLSHKKQKRRTDVRLFRGPRGARTHDPNIKSVVLYQLS